MTKIQKLTEFQKKNQELKAKMTMVKGEMDELNKEFTAWLQTNMGFEDREYHLSEMLIAALKTNEA